MSPTLQDLLARLDPLDRIDFGRFAHALYEARYTGSYTMHCLNGRPQQVDFGSKGSPIRFSLVESLDNRGRG